LINRDRPRKKVDLPEQSEALKAGMQVFIILVHPRSSAFIPVEPIAGARGA
jgi:hypothetical protein